MVKLSSTANHYVAERNCKESSCRSGYETAPIQVLISFEDFALFQGSIIFIYLFIYSFFVMHKHFMVIVPVH